MILMNLRVDNLLLFNDFEINLSYPKKIVGSSIEEEHLDDRPFFRYKKLLILMGANATGKTALGRVLVGICNFITRKEYGAIVGLIEDKTKKAFFMIDFVDDSNTLYRIETVITPATANEYSRENISVHVNKVRIRKNDTYEKCADRLADLAKSKKQDYIEELEKAPRLSWMFEYPFASEGKQRVVNPVDTRLYQKYLKIVLHTLDPRISDVIQVDDAEGTYIIKCGSGNIVMSKGEINHPEQLSSGTQEGICVANVLAAMKLHACGFYYCDEKFSHIHSEVEKAFLSLLVECLGPNEQLLFTTHNTDVLDMDFPLHSYAFMRRNDLSENAISCVYASDYIKKNDVSLKAAVENDIFSATPDITEIFNILQM